MYELHSGIRRLIGAFILIGLAGLAPAAEGPDFPSKYPDLDRLTGCMHRSSHLERAGEGQAGQLEWEARHYEISGSLDFEAFTFAGRVRAYLTPVAAVDHLVLDAFDTLSDISVRVDGAEAQWTRLDPYTIDIAVPGAALGVESVVEVDYLAGENYSDFGAFHFPDYTDDDGNRYIMCQTMTETQNAGAWWPCIDRLTHKPQSVALAITVPDTMIVASNGLLEALDEPGDGSRTYHWRENHPIATYLVSITVAPYHSPGGDGLPWTVDYDLGGGEILPMQWFVRPHHVDEAAVNLPWTLDMMDAFRDRFGEYPFTDEKYGIAEYSFVGGMEHQTISSIGAVSVASADSVNFVQPHELAHQWFGDEVSPASWEDIWLNEGFATYAEALYYEHFGRYTAGEYMFEKRRLNDDRLFDGSVYDPPSTFGTTSYWKGGWVMHMLRQLMGDAEFFELLDYWSHDSPQAGGVATTADFIAAAKHSSTLVSDGDIDAFFESWVYGEGRPFYGLSWEALENGGAWEVDVMLQQLQIGALFGDSLDIQVEFADPDLDLRHRVLPGTGLDFFSWELPAEPVALTLDPDHRLLFNQVESQALEGVLTLYTPYPNPSGGSRIANVRLAMRRQGRLRVSVYDVMGRHVRLLAEEDASPGLINLEWRGRDDAGEAQPQGVYFLRAEMGGETRTRKLLWMSLD